jgi:GT2 family glycosyltransferase
MRDRRTGSAGPPRISVVVPYHDEGRLLLRALESVASQTDTGPVEAIVVDDASRVRPPLDSRPDGLRLRVLRSETNLGASGARNLAIRHATGDVIAFLDSDDVFLPGKLRAELAQLTAQPSLVLVGSDGYVHRPNERYWISPLVEASFRVRPGQATVLPPSARATICLVYGFPTPGLLVRKAALGRVGGFDETLRWGEEWDLQVRLAQLGPFGYVPAPAFRYLCRPDSITSTQDPRKQESAAAMSRRWRHSVPGLAWSERRTLRRRERDNLLLAAQLHLEVQNDPRTGLACALRSLQSATSLRAFRSVVRMALCSLIPSLRRRPTGTRLAS